MNPMPFSRLPMPTRRRGLSCSLALACLLVSCGGEGSAPVALNPGSAPAANDLSIPTEFSATEILLPDGSVVDTRSLAGGGVSLASVSTFATGLGSPYDVELATAGSLAGNFIATDFSRRLTRITPTGTVFNQILLTNSANPPARRPIGIEIDSNNNFIVTDLENGQLIRITPTGTITSLTSAFALGGSPFDVYEIDPGGDYLVAGGFSGTVLRVPRGGGAVTTVASGPSVGVPVGITEDAAGNFIVTDFGNPSPGRLLSLDGSTFAVTELLSPGEGGIVQPTFITPGLNEFDGVFFFGDFSNQIFAYNPATDEVGQVADSSDLGSGSAPFGLTQSGGDLFVLDLFNSRLLQVTPDPTEIRGTVFNDINGNGAEDGGEPGIPGVTVFLDEDNDGILDGGETSIMTDGNGEYLFQGLPFDTYTVAQEVPTNFEQTFPGLNPSSGVVFSSLITTAGNPNDAVVSAGSDFDGVALLEITATNGNFLCTGTLLPSGMHILTAAHCFTTIEGSNTNTVTALDVVFDLPSGTETISIPSPGTDITLNPSWTNTDPNATGDIAIVTLPSEASTEALRSFFYRCSDELTQSTFTKVGYGPIGTLFTGATDPNDTDPILKLAGQNTYDALNTDFLNPLLQELNAQTGSSIATATDDTQLLYDFDSGFSTNDALGIQAGDLLPSPTPVVSPAPNTGLGSDEVFVVPGQGDSATARPRGDSGGPAFVLNQVAGVTSFIISLGPPSDTDDQTNSSGGEIAGDTRVSQFAGFIDPIIGTPEFPRRQTVEITLPEQVEIRDFGNRNFVTPGC